MTPHKIKVQAIIFINTIIIIVFLFLGFYNYSINKKQVHDEIINSSIPLLRESIYTEVEKSFIPALRVASVMSKDSFLINWIINENEENPNKVVQYLQKIKGDFDYQTAFFISDKSKNYYHYDGIFKKLSKENIHDLWYYNFLDLGSDYDLDVDSDEVLDNQLTIFINYRIYDFDGNFIGVTGVGLEMNNFSKFLIDKQQKYNRKIFLVDESGLIQAHSNIETIEKSNIHSLDGIKNVADELLSRSSTPTMLNYKTNNENILISSKYIPEIDWYLIVEQSETDALKASTENLKRTLFVGLILLLLLLPIIIYVLNFFSTKLELLAITDPLTEAYNRREFNNQIEMSLYRKERTRTKLTVIAMDIDNFKTVNDAFGHPFGDMVLKELTIAINKLKRPNDILFRLGGDEFMILMECSQEDGMKLALRIKKYLNNRDFSNNKDSINVTVSMGLYESNEMDDLETIMNNSDKALYQAKKSGRNTIKTLA